MDVRSAGPTVPQPVPPPRSSIDRPTTRRSATAARVAAPAVVVTAATVGVARGDGLRMLDLAVFRAGAHAVLDALPLYGTTAPHHHAFFTYPPFAALALSPLALLRNLPDQVLWTFGSALALAVLWWRVLDRPSRWTSVLVVPASVGLVPVWRGLGLGQIDLVLATAVVLDLVRPRGSRGRGVLTGVAAGIKLTPLVFLPFLALTRQWRALAASSAAFVGTVALGALTLPADSRAYWLHDVLEPRRVGAPVNVDDQSLHGLVVRLGLTGTSATSVWLAASLAAVAGCLLVALAWWRRDEPVLAVGVVGLAGLAASPISWVHHWVWCIPVGAGVLRVVRRLGAPPGAAVAGSALWFLPFTLAPWWWVPRRNVVHAWTGPDVVLGNLDLWWALAAVALLGWAATRVPAPGEGVGTRLVGWGRERATDRSRAGGRGTPRRG